MPQATSVQGYPIAVGRNTYIGANNIIFHPASTIGAFCSISWNVAIGVSFHPQQWLSTHIFQYGIRPELYDIRVPPDKIIPFTAMLPVTVGNDVWIGCNVTILDDLVIGNGSIIGANSVVTKNVPDYAVVGGNPAKIIKYRFPEPIIERLQRVQWWNLDDSLLCDLPFNDINKCLDILEERIYDQPLDYTTTISPLLDEKRIKELGVPFWERLTHYLPNSIELFQNILATRNDVKAMLNFTGSNAEALLLWAWTHGRHEIPELAQISKDLQSAIQRMHHCAHPGSSSNFSPLLRAIWMQRPDLQQCDISSEEGKRAMQTWFNMAGKQEYHLREAIPD